MKSRYTYSYSILRYVHDVATSEFVNVGVAVHCPEQGFFKVRCRSTAGRVSQVFPSLNIKGFRFLMRTVSTKFNALTKALSNRLEFSEQSDNLELLLKSVTPTDDSALVWSVISSGLTIDPQKTVDDLYLRYVTKYESKHAEHRRSDDDVWRHFKKELESRKIEDFFTEKTIEGHVDEVKFKSAWKNGAWHCVEPLSFDLSIAESLKEKARNFLGHITSVSDSNEVFKIYLLVAKPSDHKLEDAFNLAIQILEKLPGDKEIYTEEQTNILLDKLKSKIDAHELKQLE